MAQSVDMEITDMNYQLQMPQGFSTPRFDDVEAQFVTTRNRLNSRERDVRSRVGTDNVLRTSDDDTKNVSGNRFDTKYVSRRRGDTKHVSYAGCDAKNVSGTARFDFLPRSIKTENECELLYDVENPKSGMPRCEKPIIIPQKYTGITSWHDYLQHFENCAKINQWNSEEKCMFLAASLVDSATSVLVGKTFSTFSELCEALERRFGPAQAALCKSELKARRQKKGESYQSLAEDVRRLTMLAYPDLPLQAIESMACEAFIDSIYSDEARRFVLQKLPIDLLSAVTAARQFEAIKARERDRKYEIPTTHLVRSLEDDSGLRDTIEDLAKQVKSLSVSQNSLFEQLNSIELNRQREQQFSPQSSPYVYQNSVIPPSSFYGSNAHMSNAQQAQAGPYTSPMSFSQQNPGFAQSFSQNRFRGTQDVRYGKSPGHNRCFRCNQEGHFKRDCPLNAGRRDGQPNPSQRQ